MTPRRLIEPARLAGTAVLRTQSDDRLVDLVRDGNDRAFEAIVHRYRGPLLRYCRRFLSSARADDAVQQTFLNALAGIRDSEAEINLRPWLYRIAHNASLNVLRQAGADHEEISEQIDGVETPPQAFERGERLRVVVAAVRDLPERQRDAIVLQAVEGRSYDEIALELGVTGGAVRQLLNRARTTLREGVTALTPPALVARVGGAIDGSVADRIGQVVAGSGGAAGLTKLAAVVAVTGAVAGGVTQTSKDPVRGAAPAQAGVATKSLPDTGRAVAARPVAPASHRGRAANRRPGATRHSESRSHSPSREHSADDRGGSRDDGSHSGTDDHSGHGGGGDSTTTTLMTDDQSGPSGSDSSGSGTDGGGSGTSDGSSGSGDGSSTTTLTDGSDNSGPGSGDSRLSSGSGDGISGGGTSGGSH